MSLFAHYFYCLRGVLAALLVAGAVCAQDEPAEVDLLGDHPPVYRLSRKLLDTSLLAGRGYLLMSQTDKGNFVYGYNIKTLEFAAEDSQVRQAGALWTLALMHKDAPSLMTQNALTAGLSFFAINSKHVAGIGRYPVYGNDRFGYTGTAAMVTLTHLEMMAARNSMTREEQAVFDSFLNQYLQFLLTLRLPKGQFNSFYLYTKPAGFGKPAPQSDGAALLALAKAADLRNDPKLAALAIHDADIMYRKYFRGAVTQARHNSDARAFFQWGCLAFSQLHQSGWEGSETYGQLVIDYANWMVDVNEGRLDRKVDPENGTDTADSDEVATTIRKHRSTGAETHEGLLAAYDTAMRLGDKTSAFRFAEAVDIGLYDLTTRQVGGPTENVYLTKLKARSPLAVGGILTAPTSPWVRIDTAQHQLHAVLMARRLIYTR